MGNDGEWTSKLAQFAGSMEWTQHWIGGVIYSQGMAYVAKHAGAHWLIDAIASHLAYNDDVVAMRQNNPQFDALHFWYFTVNADKTAVLECRPDSNEPVVAQQYIPYTDFPLSEFTVYAGNDGPETPTKLFLPSEY